MISDKRERNCIKHTMSERLAESSKKPPLRLLVMKNGMPHDYSKIWHVHCDECYKTIDENSEDCYMADDGFDWLCADCFNKLTK